MTVSTSNPSGNGKQNGAIWIKSDRISSTNKMYIAEAVTADMENGSLIFVVTNTDSVTLDINQKKGAFLPAEVHCDAGNGKLWCAGTDGNGNNIYFPLPLVYTKVNGSIYMEDAWYWNGSNWVVLSSKDKYMFDTMNGTLYNIINYGQDAEFVAHSNVCPTDSTNVVYNTNNWFNNKYIISGNGEFILYATEPSCNHFYYNVLKRTGDTFTTIFNKDMQSDFDYSAIYKKDGYHPIKNKDSYNGGIPSSANFGYNRWQQPQISYYGEYIIQPMVFVQNSTGIWNGSDDTILNSMKSGFIIFKRNGDSYALYNWYIGDAVVTIAGNISTATSRQTYILDMDTSPTGVCMVAIVDGYRMMYNGNYNYRIGNPYLVYGNVNDGYTKIHTGNYAGSGQSSPPANMYYILNSDYFGYAYGSYGGRLYRAKDVKLLSYKSIIGPSSASTSPLWDAPNASTPKITPYASFELNGNVFFITLNPGGSTSSSGRGSVGIYKIDKDGNVIRAVDQYFVYGTTASSSYSCVIPRFFDPFNKLAINIGYLDKYIYSTLDFNDESWMKTNNVILTRGKNISSYGFTVNKADYYFHYVNFPNSPYVKMFV